MNRKIIILLVATLLIAATTTMEAAQNAPRPNIILVMSDDQGWGQTGYNGHPHLKTPHIDAMAQNGLRMDRFYAAASTCTPTRASVITGRLPGRTGAGAIGARLNLQEKSIAHGLKAAGYRTAQFGKWHLNGVSGYGMPVLSQDPLHPGHFGFDTWLSATNFFDMNPLLGRNGEVEYVEGESSELLVAEALSFLQDNSDQPAFVVIWYGSPHFPFSSSEEDVAPFLAKGLEGKHAYQLAEIVAMDRSIGALRAGLRDQGIADNTMIWYCSDNGGLSTDPDSGGVLQGNKGSLLEGGIRVPGIIEWPAVVKPAITNVPASTMDIFPTLVDLLQLPESSLLSVVDGESIVDLLHGNEVTRDHGIPFLAKGYALVQDEFKVRKAGKGKGAKWELYNVDEDPGEQTNIADQYPERMKSMIAELEAFEASMELSQQGKDYPEGKIVGVEPRKKTFWSDLPEYQALYDTFEQIKPGWERPKVKTKSKK